MKRFPVLVILIILFAIIAFFINLNIGFAKLNFSDFFNSESENFQIAGFTNIRIQQIGPVLIHHSNAGNRHRNAAASFFERLNRRHIRNLFQQ